MEPASVASLLLEVIGPVGEAKDVRVVIKGVVVAWVAPQVVLDQVEHILVLEVAILVGRAGDCLELIPALFCSIAITFASCDELGEFLFVEAEAALEEVVHQVHQLVRHDGAAVLAPAPVVPHVEQRARMEAEHVVADRLQIVVAKLDLLEAGAPAQTKRLLADLAVLALIGLA